MLPCLSGRKRTWTDVDGNFWVLFWDRASRKTSLYGLKGQTKTFDLDPPGSDDDGSEHGHDDEGPDLTKRPDDRKPSGVRLTLAISARYVPNMHTIHIDTYNTSIPRRYSYDMCTIFVRYLYAI